MSTNELKGWKEIPIGGVIVEAGNSARYETGGWRTFRPLVDRQLCKNCLFCWIYCPDSAIEVEDGKVKGINLRYCKGCGICARECPAKAIQMVEEAKVSAGE